MRDVHLVPIGWFCYQDGIKRESRNRKIRYLVARDEHFK